MDAQGHAEDDKTAVIFLSKKPTYPQSFLRYSPSFYFNDTVEILSVGQNFNNIASTLGTGWTYTSKVWTPTFIGGTPGFTDANIVFDAGRSLVTGTRFTVVVDFYVRSLPATSVNIFEVSDSATFTGSNYRQLILNANGSVAVVSAAGTLSVSSGVYTQGTSGPIISWNRGDTFYGVVSKTGSSNTQFNTGQVSAGRYFRLLGGSNIVYRMVYLSNQFLDSGRCRILGRNPYLLFSPSGRYLLESATSVAPVLSSPTVINVTQTSATPRVTLTF